MPARFIKQPDGVLFARFSSVVDHFTHYNLTEEDCIAIVVQEAVTLALREGKQAVERAKNDVTELGKRGRWQEALDTIASVHGQGAVDEFLEEMKGDSDAEET